MSALLGIVGLMSPFLLLALFFWIADLPDPSWDEMGEVADWMFWLEHDLDNAGPPTPEPERAIDWPVPPSPPVRR